MSTNAPTESALRRALARVERAAAIDQTEAEVLLHARGDDLRRLCAAASRVRDSGLEAVGRPGVLTYSKKVFIPVTRLCRDRCHYCTFATVPGRVPAAYLSPDEILDIAREGARLGCKEALFTLGDRPEDRWDAAAQWLEEAGYPDTLSYVRAMAIRVLEETGLLPHLNPGVMSWEELQRLRPVAPSMGMMLETTSRRLYETPGEAHYASPDKDPAVRLRVLEDAGRSNIPFTTGLLIGIGENYAERAESIFALRRIARTYHGVQEVIIQNFRAKPDTAMRGEPDADIEEFAAALAVTRVVLGPKMRLQAPPNLAPDDLALLLSAGVDDWGGISPLTPDHVNPEYPWPQIDELASFVAQHGFTLRERLTIYPEYIARREAWLDPRLSAHVDALADSDGLADPNAIVKGRPWQEPPSAMVASGRVDLHTEIDTKGRYTETRSDFAEGVYGDWSEIGRAVTQPSARGSSEVMRPEFKSALAAAEAKQAAISDNDAAVLFDAQDGAEVAALAALADSLRAEAVGEHITYVVNRNINFTNVCYTGCRFCAFAQRRTDADAFTLSLEQVADRAQQAWDVGATEVCMQGGIHPDLPGTAYFDIARAVKARIPDMHVHAFSPMEVINGAARTDLSISEFLSAAAEAGVDSFPGTAAEILDDDVRWVLTKGKLPTAQWIDVVTSAHRLGLPTTATMMYGHVDNAGHWLAHLRLIGRLQAETGGFSEFVLLPFVHSSSPIYLAGIARPGPTALENRVVHAMSRILLHDKIRNIQTSWVKTTESSVVTHLQGGVNDIGGTLMEETISRMAGSASGSFRTITELERIGSLAGRPVRQRTTEYGEVPPERRAAALASDGVLPSDLLRHVPIAGTVAN
ncbi:bifunctional FO biosynthesis protein CofGH [Blastococcus sp. Marseille-P5729]|uniref:bifunctional FO biosynthesis protein CofGH n=1 Tax=Blastococcus sp. Marseille-P5729 TaxID=2086582 RepID=UPI000D11451A|nr:bifunctional FO biosynthesis protein CofGH [Blastococcus sp. Marseille-P5729]